MAPDREAALAEPSHELREAKRKADAARLAIEKALLADTAYAEARAAVTEAEQRVVAAGDDLTARADAEQDVRKAGNTLAKARAKAWPGLVKRTPALADADRTIQAYEGALRTAGLARGKIHRDYYRLAVTRLPAEVCARAHVEAWADAHADALTPAGTLTWRLQPVQRNIAGWSWVGWKQSYEVALADGRKVNCLRQLGTWEVGGGVDGLTLVNLRYRGLGNLEQPLTAGPGGGVEQPFATFDMMPGACGKPMAVSPVVPVPTDEAFTDRAYGLAHRVGAWIFCMARGGGHGYVDFQYRPEATLASYPERQGNVRALTECYPGDPCVSQTDVEFFARADRFRTTPQVYLALVTKDAPLTEAETHTRWQEVDQQVRDDVAEDLNFVQFEPWPGIGVLSDAGWAGYYKGLAEGGLDAWADAGVRLVAYHNPGWINGRYQGPDGPPKTGGGVCNIYDWWPTKDVEDPWTAFQKACARRQVAFYPWLGQTVWRDAPFVQRVGEAPEHWSLNTPDDWHGPGYGYMNMKGNVHDPAFREAFLGRLEEVRTRFGYQGWWADSFQNLFMSQLDWATGGGNSLQRAWWEAIAAWTREGVGWMAESHAFPGMSCSIEVHGWEDDVWTFQHVWKWYRGNHQADYTGEQLDRTCFRAMARKGWTAPDHSYKTHATFAIPSFTRLANEYMAALPAMRRSYELGEERGVLWLTFGEKDAEGVFFAFEAGPVPSGVTAACILDEGAAPAKAFEADRTYRVGGTDLLEAFGVRRGPLTDPRRGRSYTPPEYTWLVR